MISYRSDSEIECRDLNVSRWNTELISGSTQKRSGHKYVMLWHQVSQLPGRGREGQRRGHNQEQNISQRVELHESKKEYASNHYQTLLRHQHGMKNGTKSDNSGLKSTSGCVLSTCLKKTTQPNSGLRQLQFITPTSKHECTYGQGVAVAVNYPCNHLCNCLDCLPRGEIRTT